MVVLCCAFRQRGGRWLFGFRKSLVRRCLVLQKFFTPSYSLYLLLLMFFAKSQSSSLGCTWRLCIFRLFLFGVGLRVPRASNPHVYCTMFRASVDRMYVCKSCRVNDVVFSLLWTPVYVARLEAIYCCFALRRPWGRTSEGRLESKVERSGQGRVSHVTALLPLVFCSPVVSSVSLVAPIVAFVCVRAPHEGFILPKGLRFLF